MIKTVEELICAFEFLRMPQAQVADTRQVHAVGEDKQSQEHIKHVLEGLLPADGHVFKTTKQKVGQFMIGTLTSIAVVAIIASGGLGLVGALVGASGSLTGGYGTAGTLAVLGALSVRELRSLVRGQYQQLLHELNAWYGQIAPLRGEEFDMEAQLLPRLEGLVHQQQSWYRSPTEATRRLIDTLMKAIKLIHAMKIHASRLGVIAILGPQKVGKSLLTAQLMMDAAAERESTRDDNTEDSPSYRFTSNIVMLDSPGLTSRRDAVANTYYAAGHQLAQTFIYMKTLGSHGNRVESYDVEAIMRTLMDSEEKSPRLLICLNSARQIRPDVRGDWPSVEGLKRQQERFLEDLKTTIQEKIRTPMHWGNLLAEMLNRRFEAKWKNVEIRLSDLGHPTSGTGDVPDDLKAFLCGPEVWNAEQIGDWICRSRASASPDGTEDPELRETVNRINFAAFVKQRRA